MPLDTVKLRSPSLPKKTIEAIEAHGTRTQRTDIQTGVIEMEFTRTPLRTSWDSRISIAPCYKDMRKNPATGRIEEYPCPPFIYLECSFPKVLNGHNIYGGPTNLLLSARVLIEHIAERLNVKLPPADIWWVHRIDWAENFDLGFDAIQDFFSTMKNARFPRRGVTHYPNTIYVAGTTTTLKLYHKGEEFAAHDYRRIERALSNLRTLQYPGAKHARENHQWVQAQINELQDEANQRLRVEVEIHLEKLKHEFDGRKPLVKDVTTEFLVSVFDHEVYRLMRQGKDKNSILIRNSTDVLRKLSEALPSELANKLHAFWNQMATVGEDETRAAYSRATFYRHRLNLEKLGVTWHQADSRLVERETSSLPADFQLIREDPRRCTREVVEGIPTFTQWGILREAA